MIPLTLLCFALFALSLVCLSEFIPPVYQWNDVSRNRSSVLNISKKVNSGISPGIFVKQPVYVSLTTISSRVHQVHDTIMTVLTGSVVPHWIYLFVSSEPFLLDKGIPQSSLPANLLALTETYNVSIIYTKNIGPHRKLLPLLARKWAEDCIIITLDDENKSGLDEYIHRLLYYYKLGNESSVVGLKVRRMGYCDTVPFHLYSYRHWRTAEEGSLEYVSSPIYAIFIIFE